ncbi:MAG: hypothetical protein K0U78_21190 [Actinomycetia bacterium]|nr:hypothetical protein [Actinomycetes bacterium]
MSPDELADVVSASAMSAKRTVVAEVNGLGFVSEVRFGPDIRNWDAVTLNKRARAVAAVAHDRHLANKGLLGDGADPTLEAVAAAERALNF